MSREKGTRLWFRPARPGRKGLWYIRDGTRQISTGCTHGEVAAAEQALARYVASKYETPRLERLIHEISVADVLTVYAADVVPGLVNRDKVEGQIRRLNEAMGGCLLSDVTGALCREYVTWREGKRSGANESGRAGKGGGAKRDLETLRAAINHHHAEGLHRAVVRVVLPERGKARQHWLTRQDAARLLWTCWRTREIQEGQTTDKRPLRHLCRFLLMGLYTGSRPGAILSAAWERGEGLSFVDVAGGRFYRQQEGRAETAKRQPPVRLSPRLLAHLRRWHRKDGGQGHVVTFREQPVASVKTGLATAVAKAGLDAGVTAYSLRHTCATWLVSKGVPVWQVAEFLGTSPAMIERHYGHHAPDYLKEASDAIGRK